MVVKLLSRINEFVYGNKPIDLTEKVGSWVCTGLLGVAIVCAGITVGASGYYGVNPLLSNAHKQQTSLTSHLNPTSEIAPLDYNSPITPKSYNK